MSAAAKLPPVDMPDEDLEFWRDHARRMSRRLAVYEEAFRRIDAEMMDLFVLSDSRLTRGQLDDVISEHLRNVDDAMRKVQGGR